MKKIKIADMTLSGKGSIALSFKEKIEIVKHLEASSVNVIELSAIENVKTDTLFVRTAASFAKNAALSIPVGMDEESVEAAWEAVSSAAKPRLRVCIPVSTVQMEYVTGMKPAAVLEKIGALVKKCSALCSDVEFRALDATRSEKAFLVSAISAAVEAGAATVTICDNVASMMSDEFAAFVADVAAEFPNVSLGILCEDKYGMAVASSIMAAKAGAAEIKTSVGDNALPALETIAQIIRDNGDAAGLCADLKYTELGRHAKQIAWIRNAKKSDNSPFDGKIASEDEAEVYLTSADDLASVTAAVRKLGYDLSEDDTARVYESFRRVAETKKVSSKELDAIVASVALQVPPTYKIVSYLVNSSNISGAMAHIKLDKNGTELQGVAIGNGPVDAVFLAIEQIIGHHYELDDFQIQSVTEGREAMGSTLVRLRSDSGKIYSGNGISTDTIGACVIAYISALNKIAYEEV